MKILMAIDGSANALRALRFVLRHPMMDDRTAITLIQVDAPLNGHVASFLDALAIERYHEHNSADSLRGARRILHQMNRSHDELIRVGDPAEVIATTARRGRFDMIAMGSHGRGALGTVLLGSVVQKVLARSKLPVLVVR